MVDGSMGADGEGAFTPTRTGSVPGTLMVGRAGPIGLAGQLRFVYGGAARNL